MVSGQLQVVVQAGCRGTVLAEFSDTRLTVVFETSETGTPSCFNVLPLLENTGLAVGILCCNMYVL